MNARSRTFRAAEPELLGSRSLGAPLRAVIASAPAMGKFDSRNSLKMKRRKRQAKKKARLARKATVAHASRQKKGKKK